MSSLDLVPLALLMGAVTYPARALPMLAPGMERLPPIVLEYLRLVGPGVLAALAAVNVLVVRTGGAAPSMPNPIEVAAVLVAVVLVRWRGNVFLGILAAVVIVAVSRALLPA
jgi:branched-subunit amino acid transport protein